MKAMISRARLFFSVASAASVTSAASIALVVLAASGLSCGGAPGPGPDPQFAGGEVQVGALPGPSGSGGRIKTATVAAASPEELPGVDTSKLVDRERSQWWGLVSQLYAPCSDQAVSIAQCVKESRPCAACAPAARLLASRVEAGATATECEAAYAARFGPNVKQADVTGAPSRGPADAPVTIIVWSDFGCPACKMAMPLLDEIFEKRSPNVRLVHKFYPLKQHPFSDGAARAAIAAQAQGRYWEMEGLLFADQQAQSEADLLKHAGSLKLDIKQFKADMASDRAKAVIERDKAEADKAGLTGTPFILINGREFDMPLFRLDPDLDEWVTVEIELARATSPKP